MQRYFLTLAMMLLVSATTLATTSAAEADRAKVIAAFTKHCASGDFDPAKAEQAIAAAERLAKEPRDAASAVTEGLKAIYPDFQAAMAALVNENLPVAQAGFAALADSEDPFLAAEVRFYQARALISQERFGAALPLLIDVTDNRAAFTTQTGDAWFLRGTAESSLLRRQNALASLGRFLKENPNAAERLRVGAMRRIEQLESIEEESIADAYERMEFARRRLIAGDSGDDTREQQDKIADILAKLIEQAEQQESQSNSESQASGPQKQAGPSSGESEDGQGQQKNTQQGEGDNQGGMNNAVKRVFGRGPTSPWGHLRDKERDPAYNAIKTKFPPRYQQLIEQYYKSFQED